MWGRKINRDLLVVLGNHGQLVCAALPRQISLVPHHVSLIIKCRLGSPIRDIGSCLDVVLEHVVIGLVLASSNLLDNIVSADSLSILGIAGALSALAAGRDTDKHVKSRHC